MHWGPPWGTAELGVRLISGPRARPRGPSAVAKQHSDGPTGKGRSKNTEAKRVEAAEPRGPRRVWARPGSVPNHLVISSGCGLGTGQLVGPSFRGGPVHCRM